MTSYVKYENPDISKKHRLTRNVFQCGKGAATGNWYLKRVNWVQTRQEIKKINKLQARTRGKDSE